MSRFVEPSTPTARELFKTYRKRLMEGSLSLLDLCDITRPWEVTSLAQALELSDEEILALVAKSQQLLEDKIKKQLEYEKTHSLAKLAKADPWIDSARMAQERIDAIDTSSWIVLSK